MLTRSLILCLGISLLATAADTIYFRDGKTVSGSYLGGDARQVRFVIGDKIQTLAIPDIARIEFAASGTAATTPPAPGSTAAAAPSSPGATLSTADIPAGTTLTVRLIDPVDSETDKIGQTYRASLDEPVVLNGETVAPRGADVVAKLVDDKQSGKLSGQTVLTLDLVSISVGGKMRDIDTQEVTQASANRAGRSAKIIGGVAALGAIIGGIAGGGKGAAVGAASGAGAGTAVQVLTKGQKVKIPSETRLTFTLQNPVRL
jgi:hypothetical protein